MREWFCFAPCNALCLLLLWQNNTSWRPESCRECTCYSDVAICKPVHCPNPQCDSQRVRQTFSFYISSSPCWSLISNNISLITCCTFTLLIQLLKCVFYCFNKKKYKNTTMMSCSFFEIWFILLLLWLITAYLTTGLCSLTVRIFYSAFKETIFPTTETLVGVIL